MGKYAAPNIIDEPLREEWLQDIQTLPQQISDQLDQMTPQHLATPYRPGGWTGHQLVHHLADSHMNCLIRFKLALTEDNPTIKPYEEGAWANLSDTKEASVETSLKILEGVHARWTILLKHFATEDWTRTFFHPESQQTTRLDVALGAYSWHGRHHLAHLKLCVGHSQ
ncbi:MAG: YfiT family bacillithiol transferase [Bacteroidota bacterium]